MSKDIQRLEYFKNQITPNTLKNFEDLDLANNPAAAEALIKFLSTMGINSTKFPFAKKRAKQEIMGEDVKSFNDKVVSVVGSLMGVKT